jgi:hypothetical protein
VVEIGSTMEDDDWRALPDFSGIQLRVSDRDAAFMRRGAPLASKRGRRTWSQPCCVCPRKDRKDGRCFHGAKATSTSYLAQSV